MYKVALTDKTGNFRPFNRRLGHTGLGVYSPAEYVIPTPSDGLFQRANYPFMDPVLNFKPGISSIPNMQALSTAPPAKGVAGYGLGLDLSSLRSSPVVWAAAAAAAWYFFFRKR